MRQTLRHRRVCGMLIGSGPVRRFRPYFRITGEGDAVSGFFSGSNPIFRFAGRVLDVIVLSALWLFCSLGVVTIGPATAALYYSCAKCLRRGEPGPTPAFSTPSA